MFHHFVGAPRRIIVTVITTLAVALAFPLSALANVAITQISSDTYTNSTSQHKAQVEPDTFSFGSTIVAATQTGRFFDGGSSNIAWATSQNNGATWVTGNLPGITKHENPSNPYNRVSDPAVAFDAKHGVWLVSTLAITDTSGVLGKAVLSSRSTDSTATAWNNPVAVSVATGSANLDKNWIVCDNTSTSPFYGNCYTEWDDNGAGNRIKMSTSSDGGQTWGPAKNTNNNNTGLGGQPVVQPGGTVIVPIANANETAILAFTSTNGGSTWTRTRTISSVSTHTVAGSLRTGPLPSAEIDASGKVYVVWQDCRFRSGCTSNDIVMSTSTNGTSWTAVTRVPIDATNSGVDHFIPGIAVDKSTSGSSTHIGITYYYYPVANCTSATCQLSVGFVSTVNGGTNWTVTAVTGPMTLSWLPNTSQGRMVGDYISTSYGSDGLTHAAFAVAKVPTAGGSDCATATPNCDQGIYSTSSGLALSSGNSLAPAIANEQPVPGAASDQPASSEPLTSR